MKVFCVSILSLLFASAAGAATLAYDFGGRNNDLYDRRSLARFFRDEGPAPSGVSKNNRETNGDPFAKGAGGGPLLPVLRLDLPRFVSGKVPSYVSRADRAAGYLMLVCVGTGCPQRVPFIWTRSRLDRVADAMAESIAAAGCEPDQPEPRCELHGLRRAMAVMERIVAREKLNRMPGREIDAYTVQGETGVWGTQDCVDQAANGTSYLVILADAGLMKWHRVVYPGLHAGVQPHWFTRIEAPDGRLLQFDLYHRADGIGRGSPVKVRVDSAGAWSGMK